MFNALALTPLLERFEAEHGTLLTGAMFGGLGLGYLKILAPPEKVLRWVEGKMNLLGRLPHYVSIDQKTYGRYGVLPSSTPTLAGATENAVPMAYMGSTQRLGP
ncbi:MAG: putative rhomboid protease [Pleopsidium flavum]|nr:MAG: putative rhomboid protease [Pleopsidium flavum]